MLRERLFKAAAPSPHEFRHRSTEISRLEGFSDAVFGFAVTLLIVSIEVPRTTTELFETMRGFVPFALTFFALYGIWGAHNRFFRRYGLSDRVTTVLNGMLLFVVLFFMYPMKFLFTHLSAKLLGESTMVALPDGRLVPAVAPGDSMQMIVIYGLGFGAVFGMLALMYHHAYRKRDELHLTPLETFDTRQAVLTYAITSVIGMLYAVVAAVEIPAGWAHAKAIDRLLTIGFLAVLLGLVRYMTGQKRRRRLFIESMTASGVDVHPAGLAPAREEHRA
jgi:uncharacterized membrane protein